MLTPCFVLLSTLTFAAPPEEVPEAPTEATPTEEDDLEDDLAAAEARVRELKEAMRRSNAHDGRLLDPASGRYLFAPSAIPHPEGHGYFSQKELVFSSVGYGVTDDLSVLAGSMVPLVLAGVANGEPDMVNGILGFKYGQRVSPELHIGAGAWALGVTEASLAIPYVNMTYGDRYDHYTLAIGQTYVIQENDLGVTPVVFATHHATQNGAWITETWFVVQPDQPYDGPDLLVAASAAHRFMGKRLTVDLGLVNMLPIGLSADEFVYLPIPWLDFAWHWGPDLH